MLLIGVNATWNGVKNVSGKVSEGVKKVPGKVSEGVSAAWNGVKSVPENIVQGADNAKRRFFDAVRTRNTSVRNAKTDLGEIIKLRKEAKADRKQGGIEKLREAAEKEAFATSMAERARDNLRRSGALVTTLRLNKNISSSRKAVHEDLKASIRDLATKERLVERGERMVASKEARDEKREAASEQSSLIRKKLFGTTIKLRKDNAAQEASNVEHSAPSTAREMANEKNKMRVARTASEQAENKRILKAVRDEQENISRIAESVGVSLSLREGRRAERESFGESGGRVVANILYSAKNVGTSVSTGVINAGYYVTRTGKRPSVSLSPEIMAYAAPRVEKDATVAKNSGEKKRIITGINFGGGSATEAEPLHVEEAERVLANSYLQNSKLQSVSSTASSVAQSVAVINSANSGNYTLSELLGHVENIKSAIKNNTSEYKEIESIVNNLDTNYNDMEAMLRIRALNDPSVIEAENQKKIIEDSVNYVKRMGKDNVLLAALDYDRNYLVSGDMPIHRYGESTGNGIFSAGRREESQLQNTIQSSLDNNHQTESQNVSGKYEEKAAEYKSKARKELLEATKSFLKGATDIAVIPAEVGIGVVTTGMTSDVLSGAGAVLLADKAYKGTADTAGKVVTAAKEAASKVVASAGDANEKSELVGKITGSIKIVGNCSPGSILSVDTSKVLPAGCEFEYQWWISPSGTVDAATRMKNETGETFEIDNSHVGSYIRVTVRAKKENYILESFTDVSDKIE